MTSFAKLKGIMFRQYTKKKVTDERKQQLDRWCVPVCTIKLFDNLCKNPSVDVDKEFMIVVYNKLNINLKEHPICQHHLDQFKEEIKKASDATQPK